MTPFGGPMLVMSCICSVSGSRWMRVRRTPTRARPRHGAQLGTSGSQLNSTATEESLLPWIESQAAGQRMTWVSVR